MVSEQSALIKLLVGEISDNNDEGRRRYFFGFWAEFHGEALTSHEDEDGVMCMLYRCTSYGSPTIRVYMRDERYAAIEQLGETDDEGIRRLEVRLVGIYTLERIADVSLAMGTPRQRLRDHRGSAHGLPNTTKKGFHQRRKESLQESYSIDHNG